MCDLAVPSKEPGFILRVMGSHWRIFKAEDSNDFDFCFKNSTLLREEWRRKGVVEAGRPVMLLLEVS